MHGPTTSNYNNPYPQYPGHYYGHPYATPPAIYNPYLIGQQRYPTQPYPPTALRRDAAHFQRNRLPHPQPPECSIQPYMFSANTLSVMEQITGPTKSLDLFRQIHNEALKTEKRT